MDHLSVQWQRLASLDARIMPKVTAARQSSAQPLETRAALTLQLMSWLNHDIQRFVGATLALKAERCVASPGIQEPLRVRRAKYSWTVVSSVNSG
jgi:hypothetical protein